MIKAAIFDMDGLLIDSEPIWIRVTQKVYKDVGVLIDDEIRSQMIGRPTYENALWLHNIFKWKGPSPDAIASKIVKAMVAEAKNIQLLPGAENAIAICKEANLPIAIASSSAQAFIDAVVRELKLREHFDHIYSAQHEPYGKPH